VSNVSYEVFLPNVIPYAPNVLDDQAIDAVRNACIDFCRETLFLQCDMDPITVMAGANTYCIDGPKYNILGQLMAIYYQNRKLERKSQYELEKMFTMNWQYERGTPQAYTQFNPNDITLALCPSETVQNAITGRFSYMPLRDSTVVDSQLYERYLEDIVAGALAQLLDTPNQPYTDPAGAKAHAQRFRVAKQPARAYVTGGMNHAPMRVRYSRIW
jgi:hypothetical protein